MMDGACILGVNLVGFFQILPFLNHVSKNDRVK